MCFRDKTCYGNLWRSFCSAWLSLEFLASLSLLPACRAAQALELWLQQSGGVSPSRFFRNTSAPRDKKSLRRRKQNFNDDELRNCLSSEVLDSRDTVQAVLPCSDVQRRVSVDVHCVQIAAGVQQQLGDVYTARKRRPVKANVLLLKRKSNHVVLLENHN